MIQLHHTGHNFHYETERLIRLFLSEPVCRVEDKPSSPPYILAHIYKSGCGHSLSVEINLGDAAHSFSAQAEDGQPLELELARLLYSGLSKVTGEELRWGLLTGVRPVKLALSLVNEGRSYIEARGELKSRYLVSGDAADMALDVLKTQAQAIRPLLWDEFCLYISIPFCPSRCSYCSFVSHSVDKAARLIPSYVDCLCDEIDGIAQLAADRGLKLAAVYIGGGTPTVLTPEQLARVMGAVSRSFNTGGIREYTVEAGRPDTVSREKLDVIHRGGAGRISINPQTMSDEVLRRIGRLHSSDDFIKAYQTACEFGFDCINTDLIAGLPGDSEEGFADTLGQIIALGPQNITLHTLSLKRAAKMGASPLSLAGELTPTVRSMFGRAVGMLFEAGQRPYYLYRQQNTPGGFENLGFALPGQECLYNVVMMEETGSVISAGAGGVTRLVNPQGAIERIFALKYPYEYIANSARRSENKARIMAYYEDCVQR